MSEHAGIEWPATNSPYSVLMPANSITLAHFSVASQRIVPNSAGEPPQHFTAKLDVPGFDFAIGKAGIELFVSEYR